MVSSYARTKEASQAKYISILNIIQGEVDPTQVISLPAKCLGQASYPLDDGFHYPLDLFIF